MNTTDGVFGGLPADDGKKLVYESSRTRVFRSCPAGAACVIYKEPRGYSAARRVRRERALLERLASVPGVVRLADQTPPPGMIALVDAGPATLADTLVGGRLPVAELLEFACELATVLGGVHDARVIHRDLNPANIVWNRQPHQLILLDFDLATVAAEDLPTFAHPSTIAGTLAYLAPEQTGRTGWPVDQRADLYGVGAVLYELATGEPPFGFADPLRLVHDHLARVPEAPVTRNPNLPVALSQVILRLLEKEPDLRYQSAEGLGHDLRAIRRKPTAPITLGERDFPPRLAAPSRLIGRESAVETLKAAVERSASGPARCLLITGSPGVGKSVLLDQLRSIVTEREGWFASGKFDQFRQDLETNGARQAMSGLCQLLLAEPEETLTVLRTRLLEILGPNSGVVCSHLPDLAPLLGYPSPPELTDPFAARGRLQQSGLAVLRTVASSRRPVVIALDDLQWASPPPLEFVDAILTDPHLTGVLVVGAYRDSEVGADHPLTAMLDRWGRIGVAPQQLSLSNLPQREIAAMLCEMLRLPEDQAHPLAATVTAKTAGNPYDTVELVNALRREEALVPTGDGWRLSQGRIRGLPRNTGVVDLLRDRIEALPPRTVSLLEIMACLGGEVDVRVLADATGHRAADVDSDLVAALEEGLIVASDRDDSFRFRHDRVQRAAFDRLVPQQLTGLRLELGRRLAVLPHRQILAAEQYISAVDAVHSRSERQALIALFHSAATDAQRISNGPRAERFLSAATDLLASTGQTNQTAIDLAIDRHSALYAMGRLAEADEVYQQLTKLTSDPLRVATAAPAQISSLTGRNRPADAVRIGIDLIRALGQPVPGSPKGLASEIERGMTAILEWATTGDELDDLRRVDCDDQRVLAIARIIDRVLPPAFMSGYPGTPWLVLVAARIWAKHGPARDLVGALSYIALFTIGLRDDYRTGAMIVRRVLAVSEARGYEPETSHVRCNYAVSCAPWFEPLEEVVELAHQAYEGLVRGGENHFATHTYYCSLPNLLGCARTIDEVAVEADAALTFATRTGNDDAAVFYLFFRQLARTMRGETLAAGSFQDATFDEDRHLAMMAGNGSITGVAHTLLGINAAIFGDADGVIRHATALETLIPFLLVPTTRLSSPGAGHSGDPPDSRGRR
jgi:DNA polymerase III delta prime subunit